MLKQVIKYFEEFFEQLGVLMAPDHIAQPIPVKAERRGYKRAVSEE